MKVQKMFYYYFICYRWWDSGGSGWANVEIKRDGCMGSKEDIDDIGEMLKKRNDYGNVVIINFQILRTEKEEVEEK